MFCCFLKSMLIPYKFRISFVFSFSDLSGSANLDVFILFSFFTQLFSIWYSVIKLQNHLKLIPISTYTYKYKDDNIHKNTFYKFIKVHAGICILALLFWTMIQNFQHFILWITLPIEVFWFLLPLKVTYGLELWNNSSIAQCTMIYL